MPPLPRAGGTSPRARGSVFARRHSARGVHFAHARRRLSVLWIAATLFSAACSSLEPVSVEPVATTEPTPPPASLTIGPAATAPDGGWIPDG
jgi:hypothetical protein